MPALPPWPYPLWIAHRGAGKLAPENTLAAFRLGAAHGYRMYECDAKLSADGVVFLLHDATLERTTNGQGVAGERHWTTLSRLDAGGWHSRAFAGEPLATLSAVARHCQAHRHWLNIEIKPTPGQELETGRVVAAEAQRLWVHQPERAPLLTSFQPEAGCCWTRCGTAGSTKRRNWAYRPSSATTRCGTVPWCASRAPKAGACWPTP
jgi:glycerophosphoryl diester phosphodiesterase